MAQMMGEARRVGGVAALFIGAWSGGCAEGEPFRETAATWERVCAAEVIDVVSSIDRGASVDASLTGEEIERFRGALLEARCVATSAAAPPPEARYLACKDRLRSDGWILAVSLQPTTIWEPPRQHGSGWRGFQLLTRGDDVADVVRSIDQRRDR